MRRFPGAVLFAGLLPLAAGACLAGWIVRRGEPQLLHGTRLIAVESASAATLARLFDHYHYQWPPSGPVPAVGIERLPPDLAGLEPDPRKRLFLRLLLPLALAADNRVRVERAFAERAFAHGLAGTPTRGGRGLAALARKYRVQAPLVTAAGRAQLLARCDTVPPGLILAQGAKESGWGTSGDARAVNNLFGMRSWRFAHGRLVSYPTIYPDLRAAVADYILNLDVSPAYVTFRALRAEARSHGRRPNLERLATALERYSTRGRIYTRRLAWLIRENGLDRLPRLWLAIPTPTRAAAAKSAAGMGSVESGAGRAGRGRLSRESQGSRTFDRSQ